MEDNKLTLHAARVNRIGKKITSEEAAAVLGITARSYCRIENGDVMPRWDQGMKLAELFGIDPARLRIERRKKG